MSIRDYEKLMIAAIVRLRAMTMPSVFLIVATLHFLVILFIVHILLQARRHVQQTTAILAFRGHAYHRHDVHRHCALCGSSLDPRAQVRCVADAEVLACLRAVEKYAASIDIVLRSSAYENSASDHAARNRIGCACKKGCTFSVLKNSAEEYANEHVKDLVLSASARC